MILAPGEFQTLNGAIWGAHLKSARERIATRGELACKNASCPVRHSCGRFSSASVFSANYPGGTNCHGFRPQSGPCKHVFTEEAAA